MQTECHCSTLRAAARRLTARYDAALEPVGVNVAQWGLLHKLARPPREPISIQELADRAELERSTAARNVRVLERLGLVRLGGSAGDRRLSLIELTGQGLSVLQRGEPLWQQAQREVQALLGGDRASELRSLLHAV